MVKDGINSKGILKWEYLTLERQDVIYDVFDQLTLTTSVSGRLRVRWNAPRISQICTDYGAGGMRHGLHAILFCQSSLSNLPEGIIHNYGIELQAIGFEARGFGGKL